MTVIRSTGAVGPLVHSRATLAWLALLALTAASWGLGHGSHPGRLGGAAILALAFVKVRLIGSELLELREAPRWLRGAFDGYVLAVGTTCVLLVLA